MQAAYVLRPFSKLCSDIFIFRIQSLCKGKILELQIGLPEPCVRPRPAAEAFDIFGIACNY
jgi:hypothetical protein